MPASLHHLSNYGQTAPWRGHPVAFCNLHGHLLLGSVKLRIIVYKKGARYVFKVGRLCCVVCCIHGYIGVCVSVFFLAYITLYLLVCF